MDAHLHVHMQVRTQGDVQKKQREKRLGRAGRATRKPSGRRGGAWRTGTGSAGTTGSLTPQCRHTQTVSQHLADPRGSQIFGRTLSVETIPTTTRPRRG